MGVAGLRGNALVELAVQVPELVHDGGLDLAAYPSVARGAQSVGELCRCAIQPPRRPVHGAGGAIQTARQSARHRTAVPYKDAHHHAATSRVSMFAANR